MTENKVKEDNAAYFSELSQRGWKCQLTANDFHYQYFVHSIQNMSQKIQGCDINSLQFFL